MSELRFEIAIPLAPPVEYNPNRKTHWHKRNKAGQVAKEAAFYAAREHGGFTLAGGAGRWTAAIDWRVYLPKGGRRCDLDNMLARAKPLQDGIFLALGLDDRMVETVTVEQRRDPDGLGRTVAVVTIRPKGETA